MSEIHGISLIRETDYVRDMTSVVLPFLKARKKSGDFERVAGQPVHYRYYAADAPGAVLVLVHGFTEGIDKFNEVVYYFLQAGFDVWQIQQRGHGKSYRGQSDPSLVHIEDYRDLVKDLHFFVTQVVRKRKQGTDRERLPMYLFGHSMGGGVSALYLEQYPEDFQKAILSSPMLELSAGGAPLWTAKLYGRVMSAIGRGGNYLAGNAPFRPEEDFENSCTNCLVRYRYWFTQTLHKPEYQTCATSIRTALEFLKIAKEATLPKNCSRVQADVLLIQAGNDTMVLPGGQEAFIRNIGRHGRLFRMENAKHEIYLGVDKDLEIYWKEILDFLQPEQRIDRKGNGR